MFILFQVWIQLLGRSDLCVQVQLYMSSVQWKVISLCPNTQVILFSSIGIYFGCTFLQALLNRCVRQEGSLCHFCSRKFFSQAFLYTQEQIFVSLVVYIHQQTSSLKNLSSLSQQLSTSVAHSNKGNTICTKLCKHIIKYSHHACISQSLTVQIQLCQLLHQYGLSESQHTRCIQSLCP